MQPKPTSEPDHKRTILIRNLRPTDRHPIEAMLVQSGFFTNPEVKVALELFDTAISTPSQKDYIFAVAEQQGKVTGYICYGYNTMTDGTYDVYWICVDPTLVNSGVGKKLMHHAEEEIRKLKGYLVIAETSGREQYTPTRGFYLKLGYKEEARIKDFYRPGDDRVIYTKRL